MATVLDPDSAIVKPLPNGASSGPERLFATDSESGRFRVLTDK